MLCGLSGTVALLIVLVSIYWFVEVRGREKTNDAYVHGNRIFLFSRQPGTVVSIRTDNTRYVKEGDVLVTLDPTDYRIALQRSCNRLGERVRRVTQCFFRVEELRAELDIREEQLRRADRDYRNRIEPAEEGAVAQEEFEHVDSALRMAKAGVRQSTERLEAARAQVANSRVETHPMVREAIDRVREDWVNLQRCRIVAPASGIVTQRSVQVGEWVEPGKAILSIVPVDDLWVVANFKEVQLSRFRPGRKVRMTSDLYGGSVVYGGEVVGIHPGTGNTFSLLPPQNATGNWIKIVQRVPVRIRPDREQVRARPLWPGLSMCVTVDVKNGSLERIASTAPVETVYETRAYANQEEGVDALIDRIIRENTGSYERRE